MRVTLVALASAVHFVASVIASSDFQLPLTLNGLIDESTFTLDPGFVNEAGFDFSILGNQRLVELEDGSVAWMTELDKIKMKAQGHWFVDITETQDLGSLSHLRKTFNFPTKMNASEKVKKVIGTLSTELPISVLEKMTGYFTRYYMSKTGRESQAYLASKIEEVTTSYASPALQSLITQTEFKHIWGQNSIIVRINGSAPTDDGVVVISAHQDSTNKIPWLRSPGADDDGSGTVTILEAYRGLIAADFRPVQNVEFHWYAAEEGGLLGSQAVVSAYEKAGANVLAQIQFDMTAWVANGSEEVIGIYRKFVDDDLTEFNKRLVDEYLDIPWVESALPGRAGSDHMSWHKAGYSSSFACEGAWEQMSRDDVHSERDAIDVSDEFSFDHIVRFSKLAVAFAVELGGWE
ncbi:peptidase [Stereum hirsutum FP-91666 SS1]|uniref:peptidase n=1 Tax=Stereum hirsutum (strain FP-91666) TaxID=721885 RepID=UPI000440A6B3|nr:peptidase [Stereum hirsutum FP-91666 SS1]EIM91034.1 peptidase [Stereum hirsutum FP-91666 SS1]